MPDPAAQAEDEQHRTDDRQGQIRRQPAPRRVIPRASTIGQAVARGISTLSGPAGSVRDRTATVDGGSVMLICDSRIGNFDQLERPTTYTRVNTTTQTPSTKCQYQETTSTPVLFRSGDLPPQRQAEHDAHDDHADASRARRESRPE